MNRYAVGSDAAGLVMGYYDTRQLSTYEYLTGTKAPTFAVADKFFAGVFGGSLALLS
jgi:phospholipase C